MTFKEKFLRFGHYGPDSFEKRGITAVDISFKQSIVPFGFVTSLFFLWGFSYGLLDTLNAHFQSALGVTTTQSYYLQVAYFGGYFVSPPTYSGYFVRKYGYRWTFVLGLCIFGCASFFFWPCAKYESFGGFCGVMFIAGSGLSTLETSANPYVTVLGPAKNQAMRINFAQGFNGIGTVAAPAIASHAFFNGKNANSLSSVQWVYLAIGLFVFILAFSFAFLIDLPEASAEDLHRLAKRSKGIYDDSKPLYTMYPLLWACLAQFMYVGAQVAIASSFINYCVYNSSFSSATGSNLLSGAQGLFTVGRFLCVFLLKYIGPQYIFTVCIVSCAVFIALAAGLDGKAGVACYMLTFFFESSCYSTIFALGLRGLGRHTKTGGPFIVMSISGAMLLSPLAGVVADSGIKHSRRLLLVVPMVGYIISASYGFFTIYAYRKIGRDEFEDTETEKGLELGEAGYVYDEKEKVSIVEDLHEEESNASRI